MAEGNNYVLGRGKVYFDPFLPGTKQKTGERYLGNTPEFNLTIDRENLDHFSSDQGIREKDDSVALQVNRTGTLTTDNIDVENVAYFFFGQASAMAIVGATVTDESLTDVKKGRYYQLGVSANMPAGVRGLDPTAPANVTLASSATVYVVGTDYTIDYELGRIYIVPTGAIADDADLLVDYKVKTSKVTRVISGSAPVEGALRYIANNPKGVNIDYYMPHVSLSPNGDYALKGDDWQSIPFNIEILKDAGAEAIYAQGRPVYS